MSKTKMRAAFEQRERQLFPKKPENIHRKQGRYICDEVEVAWQDWQAAWHAGISYQKSLKPSPEVKARAEQIANDINQRFKAQQQALKEIDLQNKQTLQAAQKLGYTPIMACTPLDFVLAIAECRQS